jgi:D-threo-aldose 1-dehydrogenase
MRRNTLGRSSVEVTELSFGTAPIGNLFTALDDQTAHDAVEAAWRSGLRYFDTAPHYGLGLAERRLGAAIRERPRSDYTVSTKVGRLLIPAAPTAADDLAHGFAVPATHHRVWDFSADGVRRSVEASLRRLGLDRIDVLYLHDPDHHLTQALRDAYPALEKMRAEGLVGAIGAGMNQAEALTRFVRETDVDVVLLAGRYTLLDQTGLAELLPEAERRGTSVVVGGVFHSGLLAEPNPGATFDYGATPADVLDRTLRIQQICGDHGVPLRAAAVRFPLGHPAVASVLVGVRTADQARDAAALLTRPIPEALWSALREVGLLPADASEPRRKSPL